MKLLILLILLVFFMYNVFGNTTLFVKYTNATISISPIKLSTNITRPNISVFYESQSPFSMRYFMRKLLPMWKLLKEYINLDVIPIAQKMNFTNGSWVFDCYHGPEECKYNKYHACAIHSNATKENKIMFIGCLMQHKNQSILLDECANMNNISSDYIKTCGASEIGDMYLSNFTQTAINSKPRVKHVPTVFINNRLFRGYDRLMKFVCKQLNYEPTPCIQFKPKQRKISK
ncbi:gamma-interferon-inducible lysosomal thiol reductase-like [Lycorma delicatula]|uniref:gamma-interferon-inducible lysosomal thiol reductase-like n=1 Tax=Lycorma delicatula TaxID=130591 RepID=UPI003F5125B2